MFVFPSDLNLERKNSLVSRLNKSAELELLIGKIGEYQQIPTEAERTVAQSLKFAAEDNVNKITEVKDVVFVILNDEAVIEAFEVENGGLQVRAHYSVEKDGEKLIQKSIIKANEVVVEYEIPFSAEYFLFVDSFNIEQRTEVGEIKAEAWYDGCMQFGVGDTLAPKFYKYCGKGCSGKNFTEIAINALDRCCQAHDRCYNNFGFGNNTCDRDLQSCANNTSDPGWYLVAEYARLAAEGKV